MQPNDPTPVVKPQATATASELDRISIEVTNRCAKACDFCYNASGPQGTTYWDARELVGFVRDCAANGVKAVSFGGGEPLQHPEIFFVLKDLRGVIFRSLTTNGLLLDRCLEELIDARPDKVHVSIHFPESDVEVERVMRQVHRLTQLGIRSGVNLLVPRSKIEHARGAAQRLRESGVSNEHIVYLPMRVTDTPSPEALAEVAGGTSFQSMSCLMRCRSSLRFCSIAADKTVAWCSYTETRRPLAGLSYRHLLAALQDLQLEFCGGTDE